MGDIIKGGRGSIEPTSVSGPSSYPTGGFSYRPDLGRVDETGPAGIDNGSWEAKVSAINDDNNVVIEVYSAGGGEAPAGTDLSTDTIRLTAYRT